MEGPPSKKAKHDDRRDSFGSVAVECLVCSTLHPWYEAQANGFEQVLKLGPHHDEKNIDYVCWNCATREEDMEDDFIAPETSPRMAKYVLHKVARMVEERGAVASAASSPAGSTQARSSTCPNTWPPKQGIKSLEETIDAEVVPLEPLVPIMEDACVVEAKKWVGNDSLRYQSELVKALSMSMIREDDVDQCSCSEVTADCSAHCINRITQIECTARNCGFGSHDCGNRLITLHRGAPLSLMKVAEIPGGFGVKCDIDLKAGDFIGEYVGDVISNQEMRVRQAIGLMNGEECFYMMHLARTGEQAVHIDARDAGNLTRFINHSEKWNIVCYKWDVDGFTHCMFKAATDIPAHTELRYNYGNRGKGLIPFWV